MRDTQIKRDNIYVGSVEFGGIIRRKGNLTIKPGVKPGDLYMSSSQVSRSILFVKGTDNKAYDILNLGYHYPILTNESNYQEGEQYNEYLVTGIFNLGPLLKELGFDEYINLSEINMIKYIFTYDFLIKNCHLFGVGLLTSEEMESYRGCSTYLSPSYKEGKLNVTQIGNNYYGVKEEGVLPVEYFDVLKGHNQPTRFEIFADRILGHYCSIYGDLEKAPFKPKGPERRYMRRRMLQR